LDVRLNLQSHPPDSGFASPRIITFSTTLSAHEYK
jgi:hypothetical protein